MSFNYRSITAAVVSAADKKPGHSDEVLFAPMADFLVIAIPTGPFDTPGSTKRITASHTFPANKGWKKFQAKAKSIDPTADASGETGGQVPNYKYKVIIKGDSAHINEFVENLLNEDILALFNDPVCGIDNYVQLGSRCTPANIGGFVFRGGSKGAGGFKEYEFVVESSDKFFYEGAVTMAVEDPELGAIGPIQIEDITSSGYTFSIINSTANATGMQIQRSLSPDFSSPVATTATALTDPIVVTGLAANTQYFIRVRATATGYAPGPWVSAVARTDPA